MTLKILCGVDVIEIDGQEQEDTAIAVRNYGSSKNGGGTCRQGLIVLGINGRDYLVDAKDMHDAVYNAGMSTGQSYD
jgi:hypothetical protein